MLNPARTGTAPDTRTDSTDLCAKKFTVSLVVKDEFDVKQTVDKANQARQHVDQRFPFLFSRHPV